MKTASRLLIAASLAAALPAGAYCVVNELKDRSIHAEQAPHPDWKREDRIFRHTIKPGEQQCCFNLDCNPGGRAASPVTMTVKVLGEDEFRCGAPEGSATITVSGDGTVRVMHNPRPKSAFPYAIRIKSNDREVFGPSGLQCLPTRKAAK